MDALVHDVVTKSKISIERERFPVGKRYYEFHPIFEEHFVEVGNPFDINVVAYAAMENQGRVGFFAARAGGIPIGFSCHFWYVDLQSSEKNGSDDFWHVTPLWRCQGIGRKLKELGHAWLRSQGLTSTQHISKRMAPDQMKKLGYEVWGIRYIKKLGE